MPAVIALSAFGTAFCFVLSLSGFAFRDLIRIKKRLGQVDKFSKTNKELDQLAQPLWERTVKPALDSLSRTLGKLAPHDYRKRLREQLVTAGNPWGLDADRYLALQGVLVLVPLTLTIAGGLLLEGRGRSLILNGLGLCLLGPVLLRFYLKRLISTRRIEIQKSLPDALDLLTVSVEAGLGFDLALSRVAEKMQGSLAVEFSRVLQEIRMGKARRDSLKAMVERNQVQDLASFVSAVVQAEQLGVGITQVLRIQSEAMREKRKQRAQETAMKAPIKMLFPMVLFIFPTLFIILLGPAFLQILSSLEGMGV